MSSLASCHNQSTSVLISESDHDNENEFDSSLHTQNESMMHKVKDVVSKLLHPSFLFSNNEDIDRSKRKRSTSIEEEPTTITTTDTSNSHTTTSKSRYGRSTITDDEPQLTDDEDSNSRDVPSTDPDSTPIEQQKKRRRTANYQHILSTNGHDDDDERTTSPLASTDSLRSVSNRRIDHSSLITQSPNERINRFTPAKQRFDVLPTYRASPSSYDPTKSPLFSAGNRKPTATNLKSEEFSANYLLASGLVSRPQSYASQSQQSPATLTKPTTTTRQMFGVNYSSINSRRLPYIERLRRRTLQDCIRLNRTVDSEPLSESVIEEHRSAPASPVPKRIKVPDKDCGIQCDISTVESSIEPSKKSQRTFPPADIRDEALTIPTVEKSQSSSQTDSFIQTNSSITIEKVQPKFDITKPKVLGNVTPFSWPKFARAQEEYARKYPEKCRADAALVVPTKSVSASNFGSSNASTMPKLLVFPFSTSRPAGDIWKCPSCTKEHPAQTATCSLCRQINLNYKKPSTFERAATPAKEPLSFGKLPSVVVEEPNAPTPVTNPTTTTTKENVLSVPPTLTFPLFGVTPTTSSSVPSKESTRTTPFPIFGVTASTSLSVTTKESTISITAPVTTSPLSTSPIVSTVKETPSTTPLLNVTPIVTATTQDTPVSTSATSLPFSVAPTITTTKETPVTTSAPFMFGTTAAAFDKTSPISVNSPFPSDRPFQPSLPVASTSAAVVVTTSTIPSFTTVTPSLPTTTSFGTFSSTSVAPATTTTPFGTFGSASPAPPPTITAVAAPILPTVSTAQVPVLTFLSSTSTPSLPTTTPTSSALFGLSSVVPPLTATTSALSFSTPSATTSAFTSAGTSILTTTSTSFGSGAFGSTTSNPPFSFGTSTLPKFTAPAFGTMSPFGTSAPFGINPTPVDTTPSLASPFGGPSTTSPFSFGSALGTAQTSAPVVPSSGFPFPSGASTTPVFGSGPPLLSSGGSSSPFAFGGTPAAPPATSTPFQFSGGPLLPSNPFSAPAPVDSGDTPNPFSIGQTESSSTGPRRMLRAVRRKT